MRSKPRQFRSLALPLAAIALAAICLSHPLKTSRAMSSSQDTDVINGAEADPLASLEEDSRVRKLFESFRDKSYSRQISPPDLEWSDISDLFTMATSEQRLEHFPINPLSSQRQTKVHEGTLALWLVEGLRKGKGFASLNPLCFSKNDDKSLSWDSRSDANHEELLTQYLEWWNKASALEEKEAREIDPLQGSGLGWYGAGS